VDLLINTDEPAANTKRENEMNHSALSSGNKPRFTIRSTIAAYSRADMRRIFQYIEHEDLVALDRLMLSGRALHLPQGIEVYVQNPNVHQEGMCKLRIKGSITEIWASLRSITED
jgi:hypothetical protein